MGRVQLHQFRRSKVELFVALKSRKGFVDRPTKSGIPGSEALKPSFDWVINWRCGGKMSKNVGLLIAHGDKSYNAPVPIE
jgi:hypothetical protein